MSKNATMMIRVETDLKKKLKDEAKGTARSLSNYVLYLVSKARGARRSLKAGG